MTAMANPHFTLTECPNCGAEQKAVANWEHSTWYCFACGSRGSFELVTTIHEGAHPADPVEPATK